MITIESYYVLPRLGKFIFRLDGFKCDWLIAIDDKLSKEVKQLFYDIGIMDYMIDVKYCWLSGTDCGIVVNVKTEEAKMLIKLAYDKIEL